MREAGRPAQTRVWSSIVPCEVTSKAAIAAPRYEERRPLRILTLAFRFKTQTEDSSFRDHLPEVSMQF